MRRAPQEPNPPRRRHVADDIEYSFVNQAVPNAMALIVEYRNPGRQKIVVRICGKDGIGPPLVCDRGKKQLTIMLERPVQIGGAVHLRISSSRTKLWSPRTKKKKLENARFLKGAPPPSSNNFMSFEDEIDGRRREFRSMIAGFSNIPLRDEMSAAFEFMTHLEVLTAQESLLGDVVIPQRDSTGSARSFGSGAASEAEARLLQFLEKRLDARLGGSVPAAADLDRAALKFYSATFIDTIRRHFEIDGHIDVAAVDRTFALFVGGFLRSSAPEMKDVQRLRLNCEPDSSFYLFFSELGLLAAEENLDRDRWIGLLPGIVATVPLLFSAYGGRNDGQSASRSLKSIHPTAFRPIDFAELEATKTTARLLRTEIANLDVPSALLLIGGTLKKMIGEYLTPGAAGGAETIAAET